MDKKNEYSYSKDEDLAGETKGPWKDFFDSSQFVFAPYEIKKHIDGRLYIISKQNDQKYFRENDLKRGPSSEYNAFETELIPPITGVNCEDHKSIINFCNKYGLLIGSDWLDLDLFSAEVIGLKSCLDRYKEGVKGEISEELREKYSKSVLWADYKAYNPNSSYQEMNIYVLLDDINKKIGDIKPQLCYKNGEIIAGYYAKNLITIAYYQLFQAITKSKQLRRCLNCSAYFFPKHASQKYCPLPPGEKGTHSLCENRYNHRKKG